MELEKFKRNIVRQNNLITAKFNLNTIEYKVLLYSLHKMQLEKDNKVFISVEEFSEEILKSNKNKNPKVMMIKALEKLSNQDVYINKKVKGGEDWSKYKWISTYTAQFRDTETRKNVFRGCELSIQDGLIPYLSGLKRDFTIVYLSEVLSLDSFYAIRLFELLMRFKDLNKFTVTIQSFREYLGIDDKMYPEYKELKRRVISPALKSIGKIKGVKVEFDVKRENRKISYLVFNSKINLNIKDGELKEGNVDLPDFATNEKTLEERDVSEEILKEDINTCSENSMDTGETSFLLDVAKAKTWEMMYEDLNVPEVVIMTEPAKIQFEKDFRHYDFGENELSYIILSAWENITEKDKVKRISMRQYKYFKQEINNKIEENAYALAKSV